MDLTQRDREIIDALKQVRFLSAKQAGQMWWSETKDPAASSRKRLVELATAGLVTPVRLQARCEFRTDGPLATWQPGLPPPSARELARITKARFRDIPVTPLAGILGRGKRPPKESEATHDLHLAGVYLRMRRELPTRARSWVFESEIEPWAGYHPDAMVRDGRSWTVIEFAGEYDEPEIARCHNACEARNYGYEIW